MLLSDYFTSAYCGDVIPCAVDQGALNGPPYWLQRSELTTIVLAVIGLNRNHLRLWCYFSI